MYEKRRLSGEMRLIVAGTSSTNQTQIERIGAITVEISVECAVDESRMHGRGAGGVHMIATSRRRHRSRVV